MTTARSSDYYYFLLFICLSRSNKKVKRTYYSLYKKKTQKINFWTIIGHFINAILVSFAELNSNRSIKTYIRNFKYFKTNIKVIV